MSKIKSCFQCGKQGKMFHSYIICDGCKSKLGLLKDETVAKYIRDYNKKNDSFEKEIQRRLDHIEKDYIKKNIKLLYIQERLKHI